MKEIDNYKYVFFKELYNSLKLKNLEQKLINENIKPLDIIEGDKYKIISNFFFLLNDVNLENLSKKQLSKFYEYFSKDINLLSKHEMDEIIDFVRETYSLVLFPTTNQQYIYYGPINDNYICPRDAIAIGLYYNAFGCYDDFELENKLASIINYIQFDLAKGSNYKISVIPFNQISLANEYDNFIK